MNSNSNINNKNLFSMLGEKGRKILRVLFFVLGVLLGFGVGVVIGVKVVPPQYVSNIEDNSKTKNRDSQSNNEKDFTNDNDIDNSKKKEKKFWIF